jgi:hypothetical protein
MIKLCEKQRNNFPWEILTPNHARWGEFVEQMMNSKSSCDNTFKLTGAILYEMHDIDVQGTLEYFESNGCYCDCEVILNIVSRYSQSMLLNIM